LIRKRLETTGLGNNKQAFARGKKIKNFFGSVAFGEIKNEVGNILLDWKLLVKPIKNDVAERLFSVTSFWSDDSKLNLRKL
jgi:hypothetical protein